MPSLKHFDDKLASLKNTKKMTKTMKMVAASKLRRAQETQRTAKVFAEELRKIKCRLAASLGNTQHPLLQEREHCKKVLVLVFTSDRGLCGGFNNNLSKFAMKWIEENKDVFEQIDVSFCGRRGWMFMRNFVNVRDYYKDITDSPNYEDADRMALELSKLFTSGEYDRVQLIYNEYINPLVQHPATRQLLPLTETLIEGGEALDREYIIEPSIPELLDMLLPRAVSFEVYYTLLENAAGEHGARMTSMDSATTNADKLIEKNTLKRNRARQAAITTEMIEIVSGAEAL